MYLTTTLYIEDCHGGKVSLMWQNNLFPPQLATIPLSCWCTLQQRMFQVNFSSLETPSVGWLLGHLFPEEPLSQCVARSEGLSPVPPKILQCGVWVYLASYHIPHGELCAWPTAATQGTFVEHWSICNVYKPQKQQGTCPLAISEEDSASRSTWQGTKSIINGCPWASDTDLSWQG